MDTASCLPNLLVGIVGLFLPLFAYSVLQLRNGRLLPSLTPPTPSQGASSSVQSDAHVLTVLECQSPLMRSNS